MTNAADGTAALGKQETNDMASMCRPSRSRKLRASELQHLNPALYRIASKQQQLSLLVPVGSSRGARLWLLETEYFNSRDRRQARGAA
jgi:hypothetical protein